MKDLFSGRTSHTREITKEEILERIPQESIFEHYLSITPKPGVLYRSTLRDDKNPTCSFKWIRGKLLFRDWAEDKPMDCFSVVQRVCKCNFYQAVNTIAKDFKLRNGKSHKLADYKSIFKRKPEKHTEKSSIRAKRQEFTNVDLEYLYLHGISSRTWRFFAVSSVSDVWVNGKHIYHYKDSDPAFVYHFGKYEYKIYFYKRDKMRFVCNTNAIQGYHQLPSRGEILIMTKSLKDVAVLREAGYYAVAPQSENTPFPGLYMGHLRTKWKYLYTLYDFDRTGVKAAKRDRKLYGAYPLFLTNGRFRTKNYQAKDPAEFAARYSVSELKNLLDNEIKTEKKYN